MSPSTSHLQQLLKQERYEEVFEILLPQISDKAATRANTLSGWRSYLKWLSETEESLLHSKEPQLAYVKWLEEQGAAPATLNNRLVQIRKLYTLLFDLGLVSLNPFEGYHGVRNPVHERREVYLFSEVQQLLAHADLEERLLVLLAAEAGLSGREVRFLKFTDILEDGQKIQIWRVRYRQGGYRPVQVISCSAKLRDTLLEWMRCKGAAPLYGCVPEGYLFEEEGKGVSDHQLRAKLYFLCRKANVTYKPWRALKHVAGMQALVQGEEKQAVQEKIGVQRLDPLVKLSGLSDG